MTYSKMINNNLYDKFREMLPLFCTVSVPHSKWIIQLMQFVAKEQRMSCKPRI